MSKINIAVATHKKYQMPTEEIYLPIQSGSVLSSVDLGYQRDDEGENISSKNLRYSELTALYWMWKNSEAEYKGLAHYRRHFSNKNFMSMFSKGRFEDILSEKKMEELFNEVDILLPKKRNYYIETIESHYNHTHYEEDLRVTKETIDRLFPDYSQYLDDVLQRKSAHMFNMFIMRSDLFDAYCEWLFTILFDIEENLDITEYSSFHQRVFGRISEILLDVWLAKHNLKYAEVPVMFMEQQNWFVKISKFIKAKTLKAKY